MENPGSDTRIKIIRGSVETFARNGVKNITMDDLARALGMSKKTIYQHFEDKKDILKACVDQHFDQQECQMDSINTESLPAVEEVFRMMDFVSDQLKKMAAAHLLIHDIRMYYPESWSRFKEHRENYVIGKVESNLRKGIEEGVYRPEIDVRVISRIRAAEIDAILNPDLFPLFEYNLNHLFEQLLLYFLYGICTTKGEKQLSRLLRKKHQHENP